MKRLSRNSAQPTREEALDPNTPPERLKVLTMFFPDQVLANPVMDLLSMYDPAEWRSLRRIAWGRAINMRFSALLELPELTEAIAIRYAAWCKAQTVRLTGGGKLKAIDHRDLNIAAGWRTVDIPRAVSGAAEVFTCKADEMALVAGQDRDTASHEAFRQASDHLARLLNKRVSWPTTPLRPNQRQPNRQ